MRFSASPFAKDSFHEKAMYSKTIIVLVKRRVWGQVSVRLLWLPGDGGDATLGASAVYS